ncbi:MAG: hypothetical protein U0L11_01635 [Acutalibacteraceae bacterium]|nr:hypothetical protein [Acutalibacteraceae bacterium]
MKNKSVEIIKQTSYTLTSVIPFVLSAAVCSGMGAYAGAVFSCIAAFFCTIVETKKRIPLYIAVLIMTYAFREFGASTASLAIIISSICLLISSFFFKKIKKPADSPVISAVSGAVMISTALTVTALFTTDYFGIGASGNTFREIMESYVSLGFHPNWRGVLYGTIVLVIMITFPRKFKKASKVIDFAFVALVFTTVLNFFLNPPYMTTAIKEIGEFAGVSFRLRIPASDISVVGAAVCGIALFFTTSSALLQNEECSKKDFSDCGKLSLLSGMFICMPIPCKIRARKDMLSGFIAAVLSAVLFFTLHGYMERIPLHSCAVVLIVGVWQSIKWGELKKAFSGLLTVFLFIVILMTGIMLGFVYGIITASVVAIVYIAYSNKTIQNT